MINQVVIEDMKIYAKNPITANTQIQYLVKN